VSFVSHAVSSMPRGAPPPPLVPRQRDDSEAQQSVGETQRANFVAELKATPFFDPTDVRAFHGRAFREAADLPRTTWESDQKPRENSAEWLTATEYEDDPNTFNRKVALLATFLKISRKTVVYSGAGLSTSAGIAMAAKGSTVNKVETKPVEDCTGPAASNAAADEPADIEVSRGKQGGAKGPGKGPLPPKRPPGPPRKAVTASVSTDALPTASHRILAMLNIRELIHGWVQQNHDGLPQKAGYKQEDINEIHGSWFDPCNQVVKYSGSLRDDLYNNMSELSDTADLCIVVGTSLTGLTSDMVATKPANRSKYGRSLGTVIISPQRTTHDGSSSLRFFARSDDVFSALLLELNMNLCPANWLFLQDSKIVVPYDRHGVRSKTVRTVWDLTPGAKVVLGAHHNTQLAKQPSFLHLRDDSVGEVVDRDENHFCFNVRFEAADGVRGRFDGPPVFKLGVWWLNTAQRGGVERLPLVNLDPQIAEES